MITQAISPQAFELVRDRIGEILTSELAAQADFTYGEIPDLTVYSERFIPFDNTELPAINISLSRGLLDSQTAIQSDGAYRFNVDVHTLSPSSEGSPGDSEAMHKLHRLIGVVRAILEDPIYKTLGFVPPFVMNRHVEEIAIADPDPQDTASVVMGRLIFVVRVPETVNLIVPNLISGYETNVKLALTDKGYVFSESV